MKCKNCGGEVRLEDLHCPYCGSPNEEAMRHARDMQHYRKEFQQTSSQVRILLALTSSAYCSAFVSLSMLLFVYSFVIREVIFLLDPGNHSCDPRSAGRG